MRGVLFSCPLEWPIGWKRSQRRSRSKFKAGLSAWQGCEILRLELERLRAREVVISSNLKPRVDGMGFRGDQARPIDPGVAAYFELDKRPRVLACDRWDLVEHNLRAIAAHVEALRGMDRWGVGSVERAFEGYLALPAEGQSSASWRKVLGLTPSGPVSQGDVTGAFARLVKVKHPDFGGSAVDFQELIDARDRALEEVAAR